MSQLWPRETTRCLSLHTKRGSTTPRFDDTHILEVRSECIFWILSSHHPNSFPQVTFLDEVTDEYMFYLVTFKATSPGVLSTIELVTTVRRTATATVQVENPLTTATCLSTECKCADISAPLQHTLSGQSKVITVDIFSHTVNKLLYACKQTLVDSVYMCICPLFRVLWDWSFSLCVQASLQPSWLFLVMIWATFTTISSSKLCPLHQRKLSSSTLHWEAATVFLLS